MNLIKNQKSIIASIFMTFFLLTFSTKINAQKKSEEFKDFKITIEKSDNEIIIKCSEGCAWNDLTYKNKKEVQAINEFGMIEIKEVQSGRDKNSSNFLFTIATTENEINLKGLKGTAWTSLNFSIKNNQKQMVNQFGMKSGK